MKNMSASEQSEHEMVLEKMTSERNHILDRWADAKTLGLNREEAELLAHQRLNLKFLFGETGFNPPVPARNPISVAQHNPRFGAALWTVNTEAYRRKGSVSGAKFGIRHVSDHGKISPAYHKTENIMQTTRAS